MAFNGAELAFDAHEQISCQFRLDASDCTALSRKLTTSSVFLFFTTDLIITFFPLSTKNPINRNILEFSFTCLVRIYYGNCTQSYSDLRLSYILKHFTESAWQLHTWGRVWQNRDISQLCMILSLDLNLSSDITPYYMAKSLRTPDHHADLCFNLKLLPQRWKHTAV